MQNINIALPSMGEGITDATLIKYLVKVGDFVTEEMTIAEVATDKVDSEVTSAFSGKVASLTCNEGDVVPVGKVILILESDTVENSPVITVFETPEEKKFTTFAVSEEKTEVEIENDVNKRFLSPLVKQLVKEYSLNDSDVANIIGSGINNRINKEDVLDYIKNKEKKTTQPEIKEIIIQPEINAVVEDETKTVIQKNPVDTTYSSSDVEIIEMDRMRKLIAEHMVHSVQTSPHVTSFVEVDVSRLVEWRNHVKDEFQKKHGVKLTFMPVFIETSAMVINDFPQVNVSVEGNKILYKKNINIGIATALSTGNLIVPVIKNADQKNLIGLAKSLNDLANRARENKLLPDEIKGGTFTITNLGSFGTLTGTPIINQPEAAILALGEIRKMPAVIETSAGDAIAIRHKVIVSLTFDHRIIDGALAGAFLKKISDTIQNFDISRKF